MEVNPSISEVVVEGLHDQFDVEIKLLPGLNVLYGKNGRGKTTLLHILANILELDFQRFSYLQFHRIEIRTSKGDRVELAKDDLSGAPRVLLNGNATSFSDTNGSLSDAEVANLRDALGSKPTYLPAFRSILERTRADASAYYRTTERRDPEYDEVVKQEMQSLRDYAMSISAGAIPLRQFQEEASGIADKTQLCRQWFGRFVPVVRYPSVSDVEDSLSEEWRRAALDLSGREQRMFEETFVRIFRVISGLEQTPSTESNDNLLASISAQLSAQESQAGTSSGAREDVFERLWEAANSFNATTAPLRGIDNSLLVLYRESLEERNADRRRSFQKSRDFETSINRFLDSKTLKIGRQMRPRSRSLVTVTTSGGHTYGLSALSSGERQILTMLYSASRTRFQPGTFLIDEPELSLHIDWQRIILRELQRQSPERQLIACTHSPEVGADHVLEIQDFEPRNTRARQESLFTDDDEGL